MPSSNLAKQPQVQGDIRFMDFAPDLEPSTPGALTAVGNLYPTLKGLRTYPTLASITSNPLPGICYGAFTMMFPQRNVALVAGTLNQLYLFSLLTWNSQGLTITPLDPENGFWSFDQYGGLLIAVNGLDRPFQYNGVGTFAPLAGTPPIASIVQASNYSLFLIEPHSNKWWSSLSATIWTPGIPTQTVTGNLDETPGEITAAHQLRAGMVLYKRRAFHFSQFIGPPFYWDFEIISRQAGVPGQDAVANLGDVHYWPGPEDFYQFDGFNLNRVPNNLKDWFYDNLDGIHDYRIAARWDQAKSLIFWHFPDRTADPPGTLNAWICLNIRNGKWTSSQGEYAVPIDKPIFSPVTTGALTYQRLQQIHPTYAAFSGFTYGDFRSLAIDQSGAIRYADKLLSLYYGPPERSTLTTHALGDFHNFYQVTKVQPHFSIYPTAGATLQPENQRRSGDPLTAGIAKAISPAGVFNFRNTAILQRWKMVFQSEVEISGIDSLIEYAGEAR